MGPTSVLQSSSTLFINLLLIHLLNYLEGVPLSALVIHPSLSIVPPSMPEHAYSVPLVLTVDYLVVSTSACGAL